MKLTVSLFLMLFPFFTFAQNKQIDSLYLNLRKAASLTDKIDTQLSISKLYIRINEDSSLIYSEKALLNSIVLKDTFRIALSKQRIAKIYCSQGKNKPALTLLNESAEMFNAQHDSINYAGVLTDISKIQIIEGNYENALKNLIKARQIFLKLKDKFAEASVLNKIGGLYNSLDQHNKAIEYYNYALEIMLEKGFKPAISALYINIGNVYSDKSESEINRTEITNLCKKAEAYYLKALPIKRELNDLKGEGACLVNLGLNYTRLKKFKLSEKHLLSAISICKKTNDLTNLYLSYLNITNNYINENEFLKALKYAKKVSDAKTTDLYELGIEIKKENHYNLAQIYKHINKPRRAILNYEKYMVLKDSMYNTELIKSVSELEIKHKTELKSKQNQILIQENHIQKLQIKKSTIRVYILFFSLVITFFSILTILLFIRQRRLKAKQKTVLLEQKLLRSQMNPHFIFNSLTAIQSYILKSKPAEGAKFLSKFAALIRIVLHHSRIESVPVEKEIESLKNYLDLQMLRYEDQFNYEIILDDNIQLDNCFIPPMLAQPFIENAIEHGIAPSKKEGLIKISFMKKGDKMIEFKVIDNGVGISNKSNNRNNESHYSLATQITKERLQLLNKKKKHKILLEVREVTNHENEVEGVVTTFYIPYITNN